MPKDRKERNRWYRYFYANEPLVGASLELHVEYALSTFEVTHEEPEIQNFFNEMIEDINLFEFILDIGLEYFIIGDVFPHGFFDDAENPSIWTDFILLHPNFVEVEAEPFVRGRRKEKIWLTPTDTLKRIIEKGPSDPKTGDLYKQLPVDIVDQAKKGKIALSELQVSHIKRKGNYFNVRGESIIQRVMKLLMYKDKLRSSQYVIADRHATPLEVYKIGEPGDPADEAEIEAFRDALASTWTQPNKAIIWHHALQVQWEGASGRLLPIQPEMDAIDKQVLIGLMTSEGFLSGSGPTYSNMSVALEVLIQRYLLFRMRIENWLERCVFAPICKIHKLYKPTKAELTHKIFKAKKDKPLWVPQVKWSKENLRDNLQRIELMMRLAEKGKVSYSMVLPMLNIDPEVAKKELEREQQDSATPAGGVTAPGVLPETMLPLPPTLPLPDVPPIEAPAIPLPDVPMVPPEAHTELSLPSAPGGI